MAKRERDPNAMGFYYSDAKQRTRVRLNYVAPSTQKEGTWFASLECDGRERYLQIDNDEDRKTLSLLDTPVELEIKNFGDRERPALLIWKDGCRIDAHGGTAMAEAPSMEALARVYRRAVEAAAAVEGNLGTEARAGFSRTACADFLAWAYVHTHYSGGAASGRSPVLSAETTAAPTSQGRAPVQRVS